MENEKELKGSTPSFLDFDPRIIPYQYQVIEDIEQNFDYELGSHELLLSGSVGSAKSLLAAHVAVKHCLRFPRARVAICRRAMPDLRLTIWKKVLEHMEGSLVEGVDFQINKLNMQIRFRNGSEMVARSWADGLYSKHRSLELSGAIMEELTENDDDDRQGYEEIKMRVGRLPHIKENWVLSLTNPDEPDHWVYKKFIAPNLDGKHPTRHVYFSRTSDNPFLPRQYGEQLKRDLDPKMARRMIDGEWLSILGDVIYWAYDRDHNFRNYSYEIRADLKIHLTFDFNIAEGKPMSAALLQYDAQGNCHIFAESVIHGGRTEDIVDDLFNRKLLSKSYRYILCGDAAGKHRDTRSKRSDYDIIEEAFRKLQIPYESRVPLSNPPVRARHNKVNAKILNALGERSLFVYKDAPTANEGFRLTKLRQGANYIEDDSKPYQHITTAIGYDIVMEDKYASYQGSKTIQL